jgi:quinoprotein glucose dehydrogenase
LQKFDRARPASDDLRSFRECLEGGQAPEGRRIFVERQDVYCIRCHKINGEGGDAGPDLTGIGARKSREYILESITYPNKQIAAGFEGVVLTMKDHNIYAGTLKKETETMIDLLSPEDGPIQVKKADIEKRERGQSGMPEELRQVLSKRDLRNLVEYLSGLK